MLILDEATSALDPESEAIIRRNLRRIGEGRTVIGEQTFTWGPKDIFVVPSWHWHTHEVSEDAVLFSFSDRPVQEDLGFWREERADTSYPYDTRST